MAAMNLKSFCDFIVLCYGANVIDDLEFILLCLITVNLGQITLTKSITNLTWKCLMTSSVLLNFVLQKVIFLGCLKHCNCLIKLFAAKKQLQITLKYCAYYSRLSDMIKFLEETLQKSVILNYILDYINSRFNHFLSSWNQDILQPNELALYYKVIHLQEASPQQNCFEFVDGTVLRISCPKINQKLFFS